MTGKLFLAFNTKMCWRSGGLWDANLHKGKGLGLVHLINIGIETSANELGEKRSRTVIHAPHSAAAYWFAQVTKTLVG